MSAILSADYLVEDFISPGVACIKPVETLAAQQPSTDYSYEVMREDKVEADAPPAQISLTDCLACSGCVTSAEAVGFFFFLFFGRAPFDALLDLYLMNH